MVVAPEREIMKPLVNWPDYKISSLGRVYSIKRKQFLKPLNMHGYLSVKLYRVGGFKMPMISTLVLEAFVGPRPKGYVTKHLNDNNADNRLCNLEWRQRKIPVQPITPEDRASAFEAFGYDRDKKGGIPKRWPLKEIMRVFPSVRSTGQARRLLEDFHAYNKQVEENEED